ncbi:MAG: fimbrillin family protein [Mangrovibacterium sp.]
MKKNYLLGTAMAAVIAFGTGCSDEEIPGENNSTGELQITANIERTNSGVPTRSVVTDFSNSTIGVYVDDAAGAYSPTTNSTASVSTGSNSVTPTPSVYINADATVYAWYPATADELTNPTSSSTKNITVVSSDDFAAAGQTDYLWATPVSVSKSNRTAALTFQHALSKIIFSITLGSNYAGTGSLTNITLTAANDSYYFQTGSGTMAIADGTVSGLTGTATLAYTGMLSLSTSAAEVDALVAPATLAENTSSDSEITIAMTIDGSAYSTTLPVSSVSVWAAATVYTYNITVNSGELTLGTVTITDWTAGSSTDVTVS